MFTVLVTKVWQKICSKNGTTRPHFILDIWPYLHTGWYKVSEMTPNFMGPSYVTVTPNIIGLSSVLSLMGSSFLCTRDP